MPAQYTSTACLLAAYGDLGAGVIDSRSGNSVWSP